MFTSLAVHSMEQKNGLQYFVYYAGCTEGFVHKVVAIHLEEAEGGSTKSTPDPGSSGARPHPPAMNDLSSSYRAENTSYLADKWEVAGEPIRRLEISPRLGMLYAAFDSGR